MILFCLNYDFMFKRIEFALFRISAWENCNEIFKMIFWPSSGKFLANFCNWKCWPINLVFHRFHSKMFVKIPPNAKLNKNSEGHKSESHIIWMLMWFGPNERKKWLRHFKLTVVITRSATTKGLPKPIDQKRRHSQTINDLLLPNLGNHDENISYTMR